MRRVWLVVGVLLVPNAVLAATVTVDNDTDDVVTVSLDGSYGCIAAGHETCSVNVSQGAHALTISDDDGHRIDRAIDVPTAGTVWKIGQSQKA